MKKSNITITRYVDRQLGWEACVRPEDGSWALFLPQPDGGPLQPQLWHRVGTCTDEHGDVHECFAREGSDEHKAYLSDHGNGVGLTEPTKLL